MTSTKDGPLDVLADFATWVFVVAPLAIAAAALSLVWVVPLVAVGGPAWLIYLATDPQRRSRPDTRSWRERGGTGYAPRRLHPQDGSCAGEAE